MSQKIRVFAFSAQAPASERSKAPDVFRRTTVPLTASASVRDLAVALRLPLVVAARPGLGTISHTLLTLEAARAAGLRVAAVVLTPWPAAPSAIEESNRATIARLGAVAVATLPRLPDGSPASLAAGGATLPLADWLAR